MGDPKPAAAGQSAHRRFSGAEHRKLEEILDDVGRHLIPWRRVVARLKEAGFPAACVGDTFGETPTTKDALQ